MSIKNKHIASVFILICILFNSIISEAQTNAKANLEKNKITIIKANIRNIDLLYFIIPFLIIYINTIPNDINTIKLSIDK